MSDVITIDLTGDENSDWIKEVAKDRKKKEKDQKKVSKSENQPEVVAMHGDGHYLVDLKSGQGVIVDVSNKKVYTPYDLSYILAQMYWTSVDDLVNRDDIKTVLELVDDILPQLKS